MSLWPSRGLEAFGFEVKVSKGDWKKELLNPAKAAEIQKFCDRWWIVFANGAVQLGEVPPNWGLMEFKGNGLHVVKEAPKLEGAECDRGFVAALVRQLDKTERARIELATAEAYERGQKNAPTSGEAGIATLQRKVKGLQKTIDDFEAASGIKLTSWQAGDLGEAVKELTGYRPAQDPTKQLRRAADFLAKQAEMVKEEEKRVRTAIRKAVGD